VDFGDTGSYPWPLFVSENFHYGGKAAKKGYQKLMVHTTKSMSAPLLKVPNEFVKMALHSFDSITLCLYFLSWWLFVSLPSII
jgi:hypothetical protein